MLLVEIESQDNPVVFIQKVKRSRLILTLIASLNPLNHIL